MTATTLDLSEVVGNAGRLADDDGRVKDKLALIEGYAKHDTVPTGSMVRMARLGVVIGEWIEANDLNATALQCWTSV